VLFALQTACPIHRLLCKVLDNHGAEEWTGDLYRGLRGQCPSNRRNNGRRSRRCHQDAARINPAITLASQLVMSFACFRQRKRGIRPDAHPMSRVVETELIGPRRLPLRSDLQKEAGAVAVLTRLRQLLLDIVRLEQLFGHPSRAPI
jgi:hypothetical protein